MAVGAGTEKLGVIKSPLERVRSSLSLAGAGVASAKRLARRLGDGGLRVRDLLVAAFLQDVNGILEEVVA